MRMRLVCVTLLFASLFASEAWAQDVVAPRNFANSVPESVLEQMPLPPPVPTGKGVISGTVVNAKTKQPIRKARVTLNGPVALSAVTDSSGSFTFRALPVGGYMVSANHDEFYLTPAAMNMTQQVNLADGEEKGGVQVELMPGAELSGRVVDEDEAPVPNCQVAAMRLDRSQQGRMKMMNSNGAATDDEGKYRLHGLMQGRYVLKAQCNSTFPAPHGFMRRNDPLIPQEGYAPVLRGGGDAASGMAGLPITAGAEMGGMDFRVKRVPVYIVRGSLSGVDQSLLSNAQLLLRPLDGQSGDETSIPARFQAARGEFTFRHVPAGSYELTAVIINADRAYEAHETVEVGKLPVLQMDVKLAPAAVLTGRVDFDDPNQRFDNMQISLQPISDNYRGPFPMATVAQDGTFTFKALLAGHFRLGPMPLGYVKGITLGGRAVSAEDFAVAGGSTGDLQISVGAKMAKIEVDVSPKPAAGQMVAGLLIPENGPDAANGRNMAMGGPNGLLSFGSVAPGKYRVLAVATTNIWALANEADVLKSLESSSVAVEVAEGDEKHVTASLVSAEDLQKAAGNAQ